MQMYGNPEPITLFDVEFILYVREAQLEKFMQELAILVSLQMWLTEINK